MTDYKMDESVVAANEHWRYASSRHDDDLSPVEGLRSMLHDLVDKVWDACDENANKQVPMLDGLMTEDDWPAINDYIDSIVEYAEKQL